jgi:hypothetical protein
MCIFRVQKKIFIMASCLFTLIFQLPRFMHKMLLFASFWLFAYPFSLAQMGEPLTPARVAEIQRSALGTIQSFSDLLLLLGSEQQAESEKATVRSNLLKHTFTSSSAALFHDLMPQSDGYLAAEEYLRRVSRRRYRYRLQHDLGEASTIFYDTEGGRYVMYVEVTRKLMDRHGERVLDRQKVYFYLENLMGVPLIFGSGLTPLHDYDRVWAAGEWREEASTPRGLARDEHEMAVVHKEEACAQIRSETYHILRSIIRRNVTEIDQGDLIQIYHLDQALDRSCRGSERRELQRQLKVLTKDLAAAEAAESRANQLSDHLRRIKMAELSRRQLRRYMGQVDKAGDALVPRIIRRPEKLIARKAEEYQTLAHWHQSAVRHPRLQIKAGASAALLLPPLSKEAFEEALPHLYRDQWFVQMGWRFNRLSRAPRQPNPQTGKRNLKRAQVLSLRYQQTYVGYDLFGRDTNPGPYPTFESYEFQELEASMTWWEWWRMGVGVGQQRRGSIDGPVDYYYATLSTSVALRFWKIFEVDLGGSALLGPQFAEPLLRPSAGISMLLNL